MRFDNIIQTHRENIALLIGNGIHLHNGNSKISWDALLLKLAHDHGLDLKALPKGASATEFFDVLELKAKSSSGEMGKAFCQPMESWTGAKHHQKIMHWTERYKVPILTTNFDNVLGKMANTEALRPKTRGFTDFYPWDTRYAKTLYDNPCDGFGIWHINGMVRYSRSIRLGLTHYMGSVQRARDWFHRGANRLFAAEDPEQWPGRRTWLHIVFNKPLLIFGLGLGENEVFLRWLLIERARYFAKFPDRRKDGWYICTASAKDPSASGRNFFLKGVGIEVLEVDNHSEIYESHAWDG